MNTVQDIIAELQSIIDSNDNLENLHKLAELTYLDDRESMMTTYIDMSKHCDELLEELNLLRIQMLALETMISELPVAY